MIKMVLITMLITQAIKVAARWVVIGGRRIQMKGPSAVRLSGCVALAVVVWFLGKGPDANTWAIAWSYVWTFVFANAAYSLLEVPRNKK